MDYGLHVHVSLPFVLVHHKICAKLTIKIIETANGPIGQIVKPLLNHAFECGRETPTPHGIVDVLKVHVTAK